jgi:hypothetical protein
MGNRKKPLARVCSQCLFSVLDPVAWTMAVGAGWPGRLACVNGAEAPGQLRQVSPGGSCRNFRPRRNMPVRPPVDPNKAVNPWTLYPVPRGSHVCKVKLTHGLFATVEARDLKRISKYKWAAKRIGNKYYAYAMVSGRRQVMMHRFLMRAPKGKVVDHIDGNSLNNCRFNLRICTHQQNAANKWGPLSASGYVGVRQVREKWEAHFTHKGVPYYLGCFDSAAEAARVRDEFAYAKSHGHARLNRPEDFPPWRPGRKRAKKGDK